TYLAVGTGEALNEYAAIRSWPAYRERQARLAEAIALIRELWTGEEVSFRGDFYETDKARLFTPPASEIPIYVSSLAPGSAEVAGLHGDGLITVGGQEPDTYRAMLAAFERGARLVGKDPTGMPRWVEVGVDYTPDEAGAIAA